MDPKARLTGVKAPHGALELTLEFADGGVFRYPHWLLRGLCPCAGCQGHGGDIRYLAGSERAARASLELKTLEQVGNYALSLGWGDGHSSGIYTFEYLRQLSELCSRTPESLVDYVVPRTR